MSRSSEYLIACQRETGIILACFGNYLGKEDMMGKRETGLPLTLSVPRYGKLVYEVSDDSSYAAAKRGDWPTINVGGKKRVPVRLALRQLAGDDAALLEAVTRDLLLKLEQAAA
jgi:hypothetical protein